MKINPITRRIQVNFALIIAAVLTFGIASCKKQNEGEMITDVFLHLTDSTGNSTHIQWQDPDGNGPLAPLVTDTLKLKPGTYQAELEFANGGNKITADILAEGADHLVCFDYSNLTMPPFVPFVFEATDKDKNNLPIGITSKWQIKGAGWGDILITLKHQPGIKTGDCSLGETDAQVRFPYRLMP